MRHVAISAVTLLSLSASPLLGAQALVENTKCEASQTVTENSPEESARVDKLALFFNLEQLAQAIFSIKLGESTQAQIERASFLVDGVAGESLRHLINDVTFTLTIDENDVAKFAAEGVIDDSEEGAGTSFSLTVELGERDQTDNGKLVLKEKDQPSTSQLFNCGATEIL